jgi:hypothetical protein
MIPEKDVPPMKRALVLMLSLAATAGIASGCGQTSGAAHKSGSGEGTPAAVFAAAQKATRSATAAAFDAKLRIRLKGDLSSAGPAAAILSGPLTLELRGHAGKAAGGRFKFDASFAFDYSGGSFTGKALSPDGRVIYLQLPALMGPGWRSIPLKGFSAAESKGASAGELAKLKAAGLNPARWFRNMRLTHSGGLDTISADLDMRTLFAALAKLESTGLGPQAAAQMRLAERAIRTAHGSVSFSSATHLPVRERMQFAMVLPKALASRSGGLKAMAFEFDVRFSDWNRDFQVSRPAGAKPFSPLGLAGMSMQSAA